MPNVDSFFVSTKGRNTKIVDIFHLLLLSDLPGLIDSFPFFFYYRRERLLSSHYFYSFHYHSYIFECFLYRLHSSPRFLYRHHPSSRFLYSHLSSHFLYYHPLFFSVFCIAISLPTVITRVKMN